MSEEGAHFLLVTTWNPSSTESRPGSISSLRGFHLGRPPLAGGVDGRLPDGLSDDWLDALGASACRFMEGVGWEDVNAAGSGGLVWSSGNKTLRLISAWDRRLGGKTDARGHAWQC
jgi:hypothetical protein